MRRLAVLCCSVLFFAGIAFAQMAPPPGPDTLGSDHPMVGAHTGDSPSVDPQQTQRTTGSMGSTTGYQGNPDFAGSAPNPARGVQGQNPAAPPAPAAPPDHFHPVPTRHKQAKAMAQQKKAKPQQNNQENKEKAGKTGASKAGPSAPAGAARDFAPDSDSALPGVYEPSDPPEVVITVHHRALARWKI